MIWIVLAVLLGPAVLVLTLGQIKPIGRFIMSLEIQQPPRWVRHVMGIRWSPVKAILFAWILGPCLPVFDLISRVRAWGCDHTWVSYGVDPDGDRGWNCSKCFKWRDHPGFRE